MLPLALTCTCPKCGAPPGANCIGNRRGLDKQPHSQRFRAMQAQVTIADRVASVKFKGPSVREPQRT